MNAQPTADPAETRRMLRGVVELVDALQRAETGAAAAVATMRSRSTVNRPWWARWFAAQSPPSIEPIVALAQGLSMAVQRAEQSLKSIGIEPIPAVGKPFDPECMEAVDVVDDSGQPPGSVLAEVQRGYRWNGRVLRAAKVQAAR